MTDHVILRHAKLKSFGEIGSSLDHTYRLIDTPNADSSRLNENENDFDKKVDVVAAIKNRIDQRIREREGNVLCVEYLVTASPNWSGWGTKKETEFFDIQKKRLIEKWGAENIISTHIHRDETTPHMVVYIVPFDEQKKVLNCKKWLGNRTLLQEEQTDAAEKVAHLGLSRGIKNSKAEHRTIKQHYEIVNQINKINEFTPSLDNLPTIRTFESRESYAKRVLEAVLPDYKNSKIEALEAHQLHKDVKALRKVVEKATTYLDAINEIPSHRIKDFNNYVNIAKTKIIDYENKKDQELTEKINKEINEHNNVSNLVIDFRNYYENELKNKIQLEKPLLKDHAKTKKWLENNNLEEENVLSGWDKNGSQIYIDIPDYYIDSWNYNNRLKKINDEINKKIIEKYESKNIGEALLYLKDNEYNKNKINNFLEDIENDVMPIVVEHQLQKEMLRVKQEQELKANERRIAQQATREREIREGREAYQQLKKSENKAYRANGAGVNNKPEKEVSNDHNFPSPSL
jgi:hypothetical protein